MSDSDVFERCRQGDEAAWRELVSSHTRRVFAVCYRFAGRVDEAEDLTQEVFVKVYQNLDRFESGAGSFPAWLTTLARHHAIDHYRRRREERRRRDDDETAVERLPAPGEGPLSRLEQEERRQTVRRGLRALPADLREPVVLRDIEGLAYEDIARLLSLPVGTVKSRINRGRIELARRLAGRIGSQPDRG